MKFFTTQAITQGNREYQEDRFGIEHLSTGTLIWVADGHGGEGVSQYVQDNLRRIWIAVDNNNRIDQIKSVFSQLHNETWDFDEGSTLSLAFISKDTVYVAVLGDSPVIVKADVVTFKGPDHNARSNAAERGSAEARGGYYVNGYMWQRTERLSGDVSQGLQMTRALGDTKLKFLNREPEIFFCPFGRPGDYVLVATDGVIDPSHNNSSETNVIAGLIEGGAGAHDLVARAAKIPTNDNATAILVKVV
jgi:serine/threonine protein phosphatase PrpC